MEESEIDMRASKFLKLSADPGVQRRRLYLLQQALEKAIKSFMPLLVLQLRGAPRMASYRMEFKRRKKADNPEALTILESRIERFAHQVTNPKDLGHDPGGRLRLKLFVEDLYLYLELKGLPTDEIAPIRYAIESFEDTNITELFSKLDEAERRRLELANSAIEKVKRAKSGTKAFPRLLRLVDETLVPSWFGNLGEIILYISLASHLARYEQACRYPTQNDIPKDIVDNIDTIERFAERFVGWMVPLFVLKK